MATKRKGTTDNRNYNSMLVSAMAIAKDYQRHRDESGKPPMSNWPTQLLGNRQVTATAILKDASGESHAVELADFQPARNPKTNQADKKLVKTIRLAYESGSLPSDVVKDEVYRFISYCIASAITGKLPSAKSVSAESTLKAHLALHLMESAGVTLERITVFNGDESSLSHEGEGAVSVLGLFESNAQRILNEWNLGSIGDASKGVKPIEW